MTPRWMGSKPRATSSPECSRARPGEPFIGSDATPEYLAGLKKRIAARGLAVNMGALRIKSELPLAGQIKDTRQQIDNGKTDGSRIPAHVRRQ